MKSITTIGQGRNIVTLINTFVVEPDKQQSVVEALADVTARTMQFLPGFIGAAVHKSLDGSRVANYVQWEAEEDFRAMLQNPDAVSHMERVSMLSVSVMPVLYAVAYVGAAVPV